MNRGRFALETAAFLTVSCTAIARADDPITVPMPTGAPAAAVATPQPTTRPKRTRVPGVDDRLDLVVNRPVDLRLQSLDGPDFALQQYRGSVVVLNVFATWCGPCQKEQRTFTSFAAAHPDDTIVIGITNEMSLAIGQGHSRRLGIGSTVLGSAGASYPTVRAVLALLQQAGLEASTAYDIRPHLWGKLLANAAINPIAALLDAKNSIIPADPDAAAASACDHLRSSTCGISQEARKARNAIGAATRNTVWIDSA